VTGAARARGLDALDAGTGRRARLARQLRRLLRHTGGVVGAAVILVLIVLALAAPLVAPYDPIALSSDTLAPPGPQHLMGTDNLGRDIFSRVIYGTRISLSMGVVAIAVAVVLGTAMGILAGIYGGWLDSVLMRLVDALMAFPGILLALAIAAMLGPGIYNAMIAVGVAYMPYIEAARALGCGDARLIRAHVLPNVVTPILVLATLGVAGAILFGASLSFLGLGAQPPTAEWGIMLSDGRQFIRLAWWIMAFPGLAITITVMAANLLGDGLRDALDPRLKV
jgi:peptide/nickel transport system permease protein